MTTVIAFIAIAAACPLRGDSMLEKAFGEQGATGFFSALSKLEQEQSPERTAKTLVGLLRGHDRELEAAAIHAIGRMGDAGRSVLPEVAKAMNTSDFPVEFLDQYDLGDIPLWLAQALLCSGDLSPDDVGPCLAWTCDLKSEGRLLPLLMQGVDQATPSVRLWAVRALGEMGEAAASARALLVGVLRKKPPVYLPPSEVAKWNEVRGAAAFALGQIGAASENTVGLLAEMLRNRDEQIWAGSALGLGLMGRKAAPAVPALVDALANDYDTSSVLGPFPSHPAAAALRNIGEPAIPALIGALESQQPIVRRRAAETFLWMSRKDAATGALIKAATEDADAEVRALATRALGFPWGFEADETVVLAALTRIVKDESPQVRAEAARVLARLKAHDEASLQLVCHLSGDSDATVRRAAVEAMFRWPRRNEIVPVLERLLGDPDDAVRIAARKMLKSFRENRE